MVARTPSSGTSQAKAGGVPFGIKLAYGSGAITYGIKDNGFAVFLLIFYNQVMGLPADLVGLAVMIALIIDAFIDPVIGHLSDRTNSRWGRRHPWIYASILPVGLSWFLLWHPPQWSEPAMLAYLTGSAILVRSALALNEVPSLAMLPELTRDYHERTDVIRYRFLFGWLGGLTLLFLAYAVFLAPTPEQPAGLLRREGYDAYAITGVVMMTLATLVAALGTHRRLAHPPISLPPRQPLGAELRAMGRTLRNPAFLTLMGAGVFAFANQGLNFATSTYMQLYVWEFPRWAMQVWPATLFAGVVLAFVMTPPVSRRLGKKRGAAVMAAIAVTLGLAPYILRLFGLFPENGETMTMPLFLAIITLATGFGVAPMILTGSMLADVVEDSELKTGHREEGLFYAGNLFMQKCVTGIGTFAAGMLITAVGMPREAVPGAVDPEVIQRLMLVFVVLTLSFFAGAITMFLRFPLDEKGHEERLRLLAARTPAPPAPLH
ncbi:MFS transporter [Qipengyuania sediminis]|uniref:MFS transporter n=1 Tax=Qipengyuania sediminis TaxID=1532023 RepID=UPI001404F9F1|nr:MFS transporter [Qipengyuania sediminis]